MFSVPSTSQVATLKTRRELDTICVAQLFLGWLPGTCRTAIGSSWPIGHFRVLKTPFQNEARCKTFLVKMSLICIRIKKSFSYQWLCAQPRFETKALRNSEMAEILPWAYNNPRSLFESQLTRPSFPLVFKLAI